MATRIKAIRIEQAVTSGIYITDCPGCGVIFGITEEYERRRREDREGFYCPNGHRQGFTGESEADALRRQLAMTQDDVAFWRQSSAEKSERIKQAEASLRTTKGHLTRVKKRIQNGVCPQCNRHFANVERHMHTKHPEAEEG